MCRASCAFWRCVLEVDIDDIIVLEFDGVSGLGHLLVLELRPRLGKASIGRLDLGDGHRWRLVMERLEGHMLALCRDCHARRCLPHAHPVEVVGLVSRA
jgi:hypothetical protein